MKSTQEQQSLQPTSPFSYIKMGLQMVVAKPILLLLPFFLDLFYWAGPKLKLPASVMDEFGSQELLLEQFLGTDDPAAVFEQVNSLWVLNQPFLGIPSLLSGKNLSEQVLVVDIYQYTDTGSMIIGTIQLLLIGVLFGATFYYLIGRVIAFCVLIYLSYTVHGIVLAKEDVFDAMVLSFKFVHSHRQLAVPVMFLAVSLKFILNQIIWIPVVNGNWFTVANIAGHAFITVAIGLATFFVYQPYAIKLQKNRS